MTPLRRQNKRANIIKIIKVLSSLVLVSAIKYRKKRRWWVRPWLDIKKGSVELAHKEFMYKDPGQFQLFLRMQPEIFEEILNCVAPHITKKDTLMRSCISARDKLTVTLRFLATGETYRSLMYSCRIAESTISLFVPEVCSAIYDVLKANYLKVPNTLAEWTEISKDFERRWNLPNILGALDGKHIVFRPPKSAGSMFYNYKSGHSIVLLALVDANYNFRYVDVGRNGRICDGNIFVSSSLYQALFSKQNVLNLPEDKVLPGRKNLVPHMIVADAAFALSERILKPFPFRNMTRSQRIFNYRLSRARRVVENAFGILANRFRVLLTTIQLNPKKVQIITLTCCVLHNFLKTKCSTYSSECTEAIDNTFQFPLTKQGGNRCNKQATDIREEFMEYVNTEGTVPWQNNLNLL